MFLIKTVNSVQKKYVHAIEEENNTLSPIKETCKKREIYFSTYFS